MKTDLCQTTLSRLLIIISVGIMALIGSCSENEGTEPICALPVHFNCDPEFTGLVKYDSIHNTNVIIIEASESKNFFKQNSDSIHGMTLLPYKGKFLSGSATQEPDIKDGDFVKVKIESVHGCDGSSHYAYVTVCLSYITLFSPQAHPTCALNDNYPVTISRSENVEVSPQILKIALHVLRNTDGSGSIDIDAIEELTRKNLKESFTNTSISFEIVSKEYINYFTSDLLKKFSFNDTTTLNPIYRLRDSKECLHIFFVNHALITDELIGGIASKIPGYGCIIDSHYANLEEQTIGHELGHCLGLYHTFRGTERYVVEKYNLKSKKGEDGTPELVNGSNSLVAGDFMSDTPADPNVAWGPSGYYGGDQYKDANGDSYNPQKYNIMCYSWHASRFTAQQIQKMHNTIQNYMPTIKLRNAIYGPTHFSISASFTYQSSNTHSFSWHVVRHMQPSIDDTEPLKSESDHSTSTLTLSSSNSELFEIQLRDGDTGANMGTMLATSGPPSPTTGSLLWKTSQYGSWQGVTTNMNWGEPIYLSGNTTLYLGYDDKAGSSLSNLTYRTVTAAHRNLSGSTITITPADCADGYLKFRLSDSCGQGNGYFTIPVIIIGGYYAVDIVRNSSITFNSMAGASPEGKTSIRPKEPLITQIKIVSEDGKEMVAMTHLSTTSLTINTEGWTDGTYYAIIIDGGEVEHRIPFCI